MRALGPTAGEQGGEYTRIESREPGRMIPCRIIRPSAQLASSGIFLHFHGGGMVVGTHDGSVSSTMPDRRHLLKVADEVKRDRKDNLLQRFADASGCVTISVGYRLSPEHPFPAPVQDCFDVADYLIKHGHEDFGGPLQFIGGESAGAYLTMQTFLHITGTTEKCQQLRGLVFNYGVYSWSFLPSNYTVQDTVCLDTFKTDKFRQLCFTMEPTQISQVCDSFEHEFGSLANPESLHDHYFKHPAASPLYRRLEDIGARLPPALFLCGTADPLLDDTVLMSARWQMAGGPAIVKFVSGAPHAFVEIPIESGDCCVTGAEIIREFLQEKGGN
ncbi:hypothetical protein AK830_g1337 [Neonectria ditissima]|uniref:Alpha/beta hydrolase fold-3 domain-containing protein n=1 Tax=Neonectria ditissima TaxID=78410 RepID=A0A0P7BZK5_9HYPO|nr:hypothetical protein AK830_g1337 [Neonectria ditissima]